MQPDRSFFWHPQFSKAAKRPLLKICVCTREREGAMQDATCVCITPFYEELVFKFEMTVKKKSKLLLKIKYCIRVGFCVYVMSICLSRISVV